MYINLKFPGDFQRLEIQRLAVPYTTKVKQEKSFMVLWISSKCLSKISQANIAYY